MSNQGIVRMLPRHFKILEFVLAGHDSDIIAKVVEMDKGSVNMVIRSPIFQAELARRRRESREDELLTLDRRATISKAQSLLEQATVGAVTKIEDLMYNGKNEAIQLRSAQDILDRALSAGDKAGSLTVNVTAETIQLLTLALKESHNAKHELVPAADSPAADAPEDEHADVCEAPEAGQADERHCEAEAQADVSGTAIPEFNG